MEVSRLCSGPARTHFFWDVSPGRSRAVLVGTSLCGPEELLLAALLHLGWGGGLERPSTWVEAVLVYLSECHLALQLTCNKNDRMGDSRYLEVSLPQTRASLDTLEQPVGAYVSGRDPAPESD